MICAMIDTGLGDGILVIRAMIDTGLGGGNPGDTCHPSGLTRVQGMESW